MMKTREAQTKQKRIEDLTLGELDRIYSLVRIGDWPDSEIGRVYKLSVEDVHKVYDDYPQLATSRKPSSYLISKSVTGRLSTEAKATFR